MARTARPRLVFSEEEQAIYDDYLKAYKADYPGLLHSDLIQLENTAMYHISALRHARADIEQDTRQ